MVRKFESCCVDTDSIRFVSDDTIVFHDGERIEAGPCGTFSDVARYFASSANCPSDLRAEVPESAALVATT